MTTFYLGCEAHIYQARLGPKTTDPPLVELVQRFTVGAMPSYLAFSRSGTIALAVSENDDLVVLLSVAQDGGLDVQSTIVCPGGPAYVAFDRSERFALAASYGSGEVRVFPLTTDGRLGAATSCLTTGKYTHAVVPSLDNRALFVPSKGTDTVCLVAFDESSGRAEITGRATAPSGSGPRHLVLSERNRRAFVTGENDCSLIAYHETEGRLTSPHHQTTLPRQFESGDSGADVHLSSDERFLYVSNRGHDSIATFRLDGGTPLLVGHTCTEGRIPRNFCLTDDRLLVVANQESRDLAFFTVDTESGMPTLWGKVTTPERPFWVGTPSSR